MQQQQQPPPSSSQQGTSNPMSPSEHFLPSENLQQAIPSNLGQNNMFVNPDPSLQNNTASKFSFNPPPTTDNNINTNNNNNQIHPLQDFTQFQPQAQTIPVFSHLEEPLSGNNNDNDNNTYDEELLQAQNQTRAVLQLAQTDFEVNFLQPLHIEQIADYNVRPAPKLEFSTSFAEQLTITTTLYCGDMAIHSGFTKGFSETLPSGELTLSFKGLHFSKMMPIKKQIKGIKKPTFRILFQIQDYDLTWFSNPFRIVSNHCQQTEKIYKAALTKGEKTSVTTSAPQKRRAAEVDPINQKTASTDDLIDFLFSRYQGSRQFDSVETANIRSWIQDFFGKTINESQRYNTFLKCFGPEEYAIEQVYNVYKHKYFFSFIEKSEAENLLRGKPGHFLFRFSTSQLHEGAFAFQVNKGSHDKGDALENYRINYHADKGAFVFLNQAYPSIEHFVQAFSTVLLYPLDHSQKKNPSDAYKEQGGLLEQMQNLSMDDSMRQ